MAQSTVNVIPSNRSDVDMLKKLSVKLTILFTTLIIIGFAGYFFIIGTPKDRAHRLFIDATRKLTSIGGISAFVVPRELPYRSSLGLKPISLTKTTYNDFFSGITRDLLRSVELDRSNLRAYYFLGTAYFSWAFYDKMFSINKYNDHCKLSIKYFKYAVDYDQHVSMALEQSFAAYIAIKDFDGALGAARKLVKHERKSSSYFFLTGAYICKGDMVKAEETAVLAIETTSDVLSMHLMLAYIYYKTGRVKEAMHKIEYLIKTDPSRKKDFLEFKQNMLAGRIDICR